MNRYVIGVDVGGTKIAYGLFDDRRNLLDTLRVPSDRQLEPSAFADSIADNALRLLESGGIDRSRLDGMGLCLPSFIDYDAGRIIHTANLPKLRDFCVRDHLERRLGVPIALDNDCNAAALAEYRCGAGQGFRNMLYCAVSTGLGLGIIINGSIFRGDDGMAGESGHMLADPLTGEDYESHIGGNHISRRMADKLAAGEESLLSELCGGDLGVLNARHIEEAYNRGDALASRAVEHMAKHLGAWCYNLYLTFNINTYVFGGGQSKFTALLERAREVTSALAGGDWKGRFLTARLGDDVGVVGAAELLREREQGECFR